MGGCRVWVVSEDRENKGGYGGTWRERGVAEIWGDGRDGGEKGGGGIRVGAMCTQLFPMAFIKVQCQLFQDFRSRKMRR